MSGLTEREQELFKAAFILFDMDGNGTVEVADLQKVWSSLGKDVSSVEGENRSVSVCVFGILPSSFLHRLCVW